MVTEMVVDGGYKTLTRVVNDVADTIVLLGFCLEKENASNRKYSDGREEQIYLDI